MDAAQRRALGFAFVPEERLGPRRGARDVARRERAAHRAPAGHGARTASCATASCAQYATDTIREYGVKAGGPDAAARSLSGGNLQKYIVGREIRQQPRVMIAAQPTWGVDVGAAAQIRQALLDLRDSGVAVLVVSEELDELFEICDRLAVIAQGRLSDPKPVRETNAEEIGLLMSGSFIHAARAKSAAPRTFSPRRRVIGSSTDDEDPPRSAPRAVAARRLALAARRHRRRARHRLRAVRRDGQGSVAGARTCSSSSRSTRCTTLGELLLKASPLMLCAVGLAVGYRANVWNIGAEGQLIMGAICGGGVALAFHEAEIALGAAR